MLQRVSTKDLEHVCKKNGLLYLLEIEVDGKMVVKIGVTCREKIEDRCAEILVSYFKSYRYFPYLKPKRFRKVDDVFDKEKWLLDYFKERKYVSEKKFGGCQELVDVDVDEVVDVYERLISGTV